MGDKDLMDKINKLSDLNGFTPYSLAAFAYATEAITKDEFRDYLKQLSSHWKNLK